ncbi:hypothetical protein PPYR_14013 [Photinus pyralis]|uniref:G-protein coupled receptors family 2 profile 2 domain-containing protein n=1 Tax=Photinus pyralis TaxID=7054 RepID=A0A5N4A430_PHOPY|nr:hypothetical protein PPYR_14013 [Photinus pyralis]
MGGLNCAALLIFVLKTAVFCEKSVVSYSVQDKIYNSSTQCAQNLTCIRKCCDVDYVMREKTCILRNDTDLNIPVYEATEVTGQVIVEYLVGFINCDHGFYKLEPNVYEDDAYYLQTNGSLWMPNTGEWLGFEEFCLENMGGNEISALLCFSERMMISLPFLFATFLVYAVLPDLTLHAKCLMCYVITLGLGYASLLFIQFNSSLIEDASCATIGISCYYFLMTSFFWMNAIAIDIWWTFSGLRRLSGSRKESERKHFFLYCGYACGASFLLISIVVGLTVGDVDQKAWYYPGFGKNQCWFKGEMAQCLYIYVPLAAIIIANVVLFAVTAFKIKRVQRDTAVLRKEDKSYENDKQKFHLFLKLMLAMGVNWTTEFVSWLVNWQVAHVPPSVWYLTDFCNAVYGVLIFFLFVFKRNVWKQLKRRYYMIIGKPHLARSDTETSTTRS